MNEEPTRQASQLPLDAATRLAYERTFLGYERTQMGWVRTALSLISFGFSIAKFFEYLHENQARREPLLSSRAVGIVMIATGLVSLAAARVQHGRAVKILRERCPDLPLSVAGFTAALIALLGILALLSALLRQS